MHMKSKWTNLPTQVFLWIIQDLKLPLDILSHTKLYERSRTFDWTKRYFLILNQSEP